MQCAISHSRLTTLDLLYFYFEIFRVTVMYLRGVDQSRKTLSEVDVCVPSEEK